MGTEIDRQNSIQSNLHDMFSDNHDTSIAMTVTESKSFEPIAMAITESNSFGSVNMRDDFHQSEGSDGKSIASQNSKSSYSSNTPRNRNDNTSSGNQHPYHHSHHSHNSGYHKYGGSWNHGPPNYHSQGPPSSHYHMNQQSYYGGPSPRHYNNGHPPPSSYDHLYGNNHNQPYGNNSAPPPYPHMHQPPSNYPHYPPNYNRGPYHPPPPSSYPPPYHNQSYGHGPPPPRPPASNSTAGASGMSVTSTGSHSKKRALDGGYTVHRSNSSSSTCSGGTFSSISNYISESPLKRERTSSNSPSKGQSHRRTHSGSSTTSTISFGALSMGSFERGKDHESKKLSKSIVRDSRDDRLSKRNDHVNLFDTVENTSSIHQQDLGITPVSKNTKTSLKIEDTSFADAYLFDVGDKSRTNKSKLSPLQSDSFDEDFNISPKERAIIPLSSDEKVKKSDENDRDTSYSPAFHTECLDIAPQLSWSIDGVDTPRDGTLSPMFWKNEEPTSDDQKENVENKVKTVKEEERDFDDDFLHLTESLSPSSLDGDLLNGKTTPIPIFFDRRHDDDDCIVNNRKDRKEIKDADCGSPHRPANHYRGREPDCYQSYSSPQPRNPMHLSPPRSYHGHSHPPTPMSSALSPPRSYHGHSHPPTPMSSAPHMSSSYDMRDDNYPRHPGGRMNGPSDYQSPRVYGTPHHPGVHPGDRVRNLRGRLPPPTTSMPQGGHAPTPLHVPSHMPSRNPHFLTSPIGVGGMSRNMMGLRSPHHMTPSRGGFSPRPHMNNSKRKCIPLKTPIPSKYQGDIEKMKNAQVPEFTSLVNFPAHMSQKQNVLPEGMRCCVMCGHACACSQGTKNNKKGGKGSVNNKLDDNNICQNSSVNNNNGSYAVIPTQNKGLCTHCDVNVWVVTANGLEIKWCKGCKNFRPWAAFGDKGLATKCVRCRERQREKYAAQKEEKEKTKVSEVNAM